MDELEKSFAKNVIIKHEQLLNKLEEYDKDDFQYTCLTILERKFYNRYIEFKRLKGKDDSAKVAKRCWLDVKKELRKFNK